MGHGSRAMRKHISINLDMDLLNEAASALGTTGVSETVHAALDDVTRRMRMEILEFEPAIDVADLSAMRTSRSTIPSGEVWLATWRELGERVDSAAVDPATTREILDRDRR